MAVDVNATFVKVAAAAAPPGRKGAYTYGADRTGEATDCHTEARCFSVTLAGTAHTPPAHTS